MGSGREGGSPPTALASASKQVMSSGSMLLHKLQREELLDGGSASYSNAAMSFLSENQNPNPNPRVRTPRAGNTPIQSPRSMSPLRSPTSTAAAETASLAVVDFQEAILRASHMQKSFSRVENHSLLEEEAVDFQMQKTFFRVSNQEEEGEECEAPPGLPMPLTRSKSDIAHTHGQQQKRHRSPFASGRVRSSEAAMDQEAPGSVRSTRKADMANFAPSERVLLERSKSQRRSKSSSSSAAAAVLEETHENPNERKSSRSSTRRTRVEALQDIPHSDLGMGDATRANRHSHTRLHTRQHKHKIPEPIDAMARQPSPTGIHFVQRSPPVHHDQQQSPELHPSAYRAECYSTATSSPSTASRRASGEARATENSDWLQFMGDIIMWRHIPRSALLFGVGCFCIMSASLIQDMQFSAISVTAYVALFYLAARFIKITFLRGAIPASLSPVHMLTEADVLRLVRVLLPPINIMLQKLEELFSGEPMVTLKVAGALWFLAQAGSMMNLWALVRMAYFALFTVPKCYSSYNEQIQGQARNLLHLVWTTWRACGHKKAVLLAAFVVAWNFSSVSTRVCGAFVALVTLRAYQHVVRSGLEIGSNTLNPLE